MTIVAGRGCRVRGGAGRGGRRKGMAGLLDVGEEVDSLGTKQLLEGREMRNRNLGVWL